MYFAYAHYSDIFTMNIIYVRFVEAKSPYAIVGFEKLKNQRNDCDLTFLAWAWTCTGAFAWTWGCAWVWYISCFNGPKAFGLLAINHDLIC